MRLVAKAIRRKAGRPIIYHAGIKVTGADLTGRVLRLALFLPWRKEVRHDPEGNERSGEQKQRGH